MRPHLPEEELHAWLDGELSSAQRAEVSEHLLACLICRALEAEVRSLRDRAAALLAAAVPAPHQLPVPAAGRRRIRVLRPAAAAAVALLVAGTSWLAVGVLPRSGDSSAATGLVTASVAPAILAVIGGPTDSPVSADLDSTAQAEAGASRNRRFSLATRSMTPRVVNSRAGYTPAPLTPLRAMDPLVEVSPSVTGAAWQTASFQQARATGAIAHLDGVPVSGVRLQPTPKGGRPTAMVRQLLDDGRAVWVIEGTEGEVHDVARLLEASGLTISQSRRSVPDYVGPTDAPTRTVRVVTIASYLPYDSLETLSHRLRLE